MSGDGEPAAGDEITLSLRYRHGHGGFSAYFAALREGRALASRDADGERVSFPPRPDAPPRSCVHLSGLGTVSAVTRGPAVLPLTGETIAACFALVAMDGADNLTFARVLDAGDVLAAGDRVRLVAVTGVVPHPAQAACFVRHDERGDRP